MSDAFPLRTADHQKSSAVDRTVDLFWLFVTGHLLLWTLLPTFIQPNIPLDTLEMLYWGHEWQLGYYKHPPLPGWLAEFFCVVLGRAAWPTYLAAQLCVVSCFWAAWRLARDFLKPWHALCAAMLLEASYYYNYVTPELNNNIVARTFWALSVLFLYRAICHRRMYTWSLCGVMLALGMLSKYDTALLAVVMLGFSVIHPVARPLWKTFGPYLMLAVSIVVFAPHAYWLYINDFPTLSYFLERSENSGQWTDHVINPLRFFLSQLVAVGPMVLVAWPLVKSWRLQRPENDWRRFQRDFLLSMVLGPPSLILLASLGTGVVIRSMWGTALWTYAGLLLFSVVSLHEAMSQFRVVARRCVLATTIFSLGLIFHDVVLPHQRGEGSRVHYPGKQLAAEVERRWQSRSDQPLQVVAGSWWPAANVAFYGKHRPSVYADLDRRKSPWTSDAQLRRTGGVILWQMGHEKNQILQGLKTRLPNVAIEPPIIAHWETSAALPELEIGMAMLDPECKQE